MKEKQTENIWGRGFKRTKQREEVYGILEKSAVPVTAQEIYKIQLLEKPKECQYALSTVYRVLNAFEEHHLVKKSFLPGEDMARYELERNIHEHYAVCLVCHKRVPISKCPFESGGIQVAEDGFDITGHRIELYGYCRACRQRDNRTGDR